MSPKLLNILLIVASFVLYFYVIDPLYTGADAGIWSPGDQNITALQGVNDNYDRTLKGVDRLTKQASDVEKQYASFDDESKRRIMIMVPSEINNIKLLSEMTKIAAEHGVFLSGLAVKDKMTGEYSISFSINTTYEKFKDFITYYEKSMRLLTLQSVAFNPSKSESEPVKFTVELSTYYLK